MDSIGKLPRDYLRRFARDHLDSKEHAKKDTVQIRKWVRDTLASSQVSATQRATFMRTLDAEAAKKRKGKPTSEVGETKRGSGAKQGKGEAKSTSRAKHVQKEVKVDDLFLDLPGELQALVAEGLDSADERKLAGAGAPYAKGLAGRVAECMPGDSLRKCRAILRKEFYHDYYAPAMRDANLSDDLPLAALQFYSRDERHAYLREQQRKNKNSGEDEDADTDEIKTGADGDDDEDEEGDARTKPTADDVKIATTRDYKCVKTCMRVVAQRLDAWLPPLTFEQTRNMRMYPVDMRGDRPDPYHYIDVAITRNLFGTFDVQVVFVVQDDGNAHDPEEIAQFDKAREIERLYARKHLTLKKDPDLRNRFTGTSVDVDQAAKVVFSLASAFADYMLYDFTEFMSKIKRLAPRPALSEHNRAEEKKGAAALMSSALDAIARAMHAEQDVLAVDSIFVRGIPTSEAFVEQLKARLPNADEVDTRDWKERHDDLSLEPLSDDEDDDFDY